MEARLEMLVLRLGGVHVWGDALNVFLEVGQTARGAQRDFKHTGNSPHEKQDSVSDLPDKAGVLGLGYDPECFYLIQELYLIPSRSEAYTYIEQIRPLWKTAHRMSNGYLAQRIPRLN